jgi:polyisoprenoid-binding protein YceI
MLMPYQLVRFALPVSLGLGMIGFATVPVPQMADRLTTQAAPRGPELNLVVAPTGNEVRYRVQERLVGINLPYEAIGRTNEVTGSLMLDSLGALVPGKSKFVVHLENLKSDRQGRDESVQDMLKVAEYPDAEFVPTVIQGLPANFATVDTVSFKIVGKLTVSGMTRPTTWKVTGKFNQNAATGTAITGFTWSDFALTPPSGRPILSLADSLHLEFDFHLIPRKP